MLLGVTPSETPGVDDVVDALGGDDVDAVAAWLPLCCSDAVELLLDDVTEPDDDDVLDVAGAAVAGEAINITIAKATPIAPHT